MNYYWCTDHRRVETDDDKCAGNTVLGPYRSEAEARSALGRIKARNERFDDEDERWSGERS